MRESKSPAQSKTLWFSLATIAGGILTAIAGSDILSDQPELAGILIAFVGLINAVLRLITRERIKLALLVVALGLAGAGTAHAVEFVLDLPPGRHYLMVDVDDGGSLIAKKLEVVSIGGEPSEPTDPVEPADPVDPGSLLPLSRDVFNVAHQVKGDSDPKSTALALAAVYAKVADEVEDGLDGQSAMMAVRMATDLVLNSRPGAAEAWRPFRDLVSQRFSELAQRGTIDYANHLDQVAVGLQAAGDGSTRAIDLKLVLAIVRLVLDLLREQDLFPAG